jgi:hypothetical protein
MPKRIEHKIINGVEKKRCAGCKEFLPLDQFHKTGQGNSWDGLLCSCLVCVKAYRNGNMHRKSVVQYGHMKRRVQGENYIRKGVEVRISLEEFEEWYTANYFKGGAVDRINDQDHYEAGNLQILTPTEHNEKRRADRLDALNVKEAFGRYCYTCATEKPFTDFYVKKKKITKRNPLGLDETCKECSKKLRRELFKLKGK